MTKEECALVILNFLHFLSQFLTYEVCIVPHEGAPKKDCSAGSNLRIKDAARDSCAGTVVSILLECGYGYNTAS